jgi:hypothetical protein
MNVCTQIASISFKVRCLTSQQIVQILLTEWMERADGAGGADGVCWTEWTQQKLFARMRRMMRKIRLFEPNEHQQQLRLIPSTQTALKKFADQMNPQSQWPKCPSASLNCWLR